MLNLRAHHILCLIIPDPNEFCSTATKMFREKGYNDEYINAYIKIFKIAHTNNAEKIRILESPKWDDTCKYCHNYKEGECTSLQTKTFDKYDEEVMALLGLNVGNTINVCDLRKLIEEKIDPQNMPRVCRECLFDLHEKCRTILICTSNKGNTKRTSDA